MALAFDCASPSAIAQGQPAAYTFYETNPNFDWNFKEALVTQFPLGQPSPASLHGCIARCCTSSPAASCLMQMPHHRFEHWVVVQAAADLNSDDSDR